MNEYAGKEKKMSGRQYNGTEKKTIIEICSLCRDWSMAHCDRCEIKEEYGIDGEKMASKGLEDKSAHKQTD